VLTAEPDALLVDELAQGLGFWAARYFTVPGSPQLAGFVAADRFRDRVSAG
jgi:hypothetical protein